MSDYTAYQFDSSILREYDIRGVVGKTLNEKDALYVGLAFGTRLVNDGYKTLGLSYDGRHSSPSLAKALIEGLNACGIDVEFYGIGPTPMAYYAQAERDLDACISVTGSHNPPDYNGIKMVTRDNPVYGEQIKQLGEIAASGQFALSPEKGTCTEIDIYEEYTSRLAADYHEPPPGQKPLKVVWDAGNGAAGAVLKQLAEKLPGEHILLFEDVDGDFPNHHPDPSVEANLEDLRRLVADYQADVGVAFDGDGDRIGVIDPLGTVLWGDQLTALFMKEILTRNPENKQCIFDVKCSKPVLDRVTQWGGEPVLWKTGHSLAKVKLKETGAPLGGEMSGHIFIKDGFYGHDDALYNAIRLFNVIYAFGDVTKLISLFPRSSATPEIRFSVPEEDKFAIIDRIKANLTTDSTVSVLAIDGVRVTTPDGWFLVRASNTENALTIRAEAVRPDRFEPIKQRMADELAKAGAPIPKEKLN